MPFIIHERPAMKKFERPEYMSLTPGMHIVRFIEPLENALFAEKHFLVTKTGKITIKCIGEGCPVCENNRRIYKANPKDYALQPGYFSRSDSYTINVLDRTMVKTCPNPSCNAEVKGNPAQCPECHTLLVKEPEHASNKVKLMQLSRTLVAQLNEVEKTQLDKETRTPIPLTVYDIVFSVTSGPGGKKIVTPIPAPSSNDVVEVPEEALLNKDCLITLTPEEIVALLSGTSLKDIFTARGKSPSAQADAVAVSNTTAVMPEAVAAEVQERIKQLYGE